jgi:hypothetical protein
MSPRSAIFGWRRCCASLRCSYPTPSVPCGCCSPFFPVNATRMWSATGCPRGRTAIIRRKTGLHRATAPMLSSPERGRRCAHGPANAQDRVGDRPIDWPSRRRSPTGSCLPHGRCMHLSPARGRKTVAASPARRGAAAQFHPLRSPASGAEIFCTLGADRRCPEVLPDARGSCATDC